MRRRSGVLERIRRGLTCHDEWNIGVVDTPVSAFVDPAFRPDIRWLPDPPAGRLTANPFVFLHSGVPYVLYQDYAFGKERGRIAAMRLTAEGATAACGPVLSADIHLAYPCVFTWGGETWCVPETLEKAEVGLYRLRRIPGTLEMVAVLLSGTRAVDPTIFAHGSRWWLAFTDQATGSNEALYLYFAGSPLGPWTPHLGNPVKRDVASSRPAGTPFVHDGVLYRPAQDCSETYGGRIALNRVDELTPERFAEETVRWIEPDRTGPRPHGLHTISSVGNLTVVDGKRERFVPAAARAALTRYLRQAVFGPPYRPRRTTPAADDAAGAEVHP